MRIRVLSDLHLEFMLDRWSRFIESIANDADVLVLAGDIVSGQLTPIAMRAFCRRFDNVVFVAGNHEFYGASVTGILEMLGGIDEPNFHWLEMGEVRIGSLGETGGVRFVGATLWFNEPPAPMPFRPNPRNMMTDFHVISGLEPWVYEQNRRTIDWLCANVREGDVVVTHHLPSARSVHPKYIGSPLNRFFLGTMTRELDDLIERTKPAAWIHGHTHESCDYRIGDTRVLCNPYGYDRQETNSQFDPGLTIEVPA